MLLWAAKQNLGVNITTWVELWHVDHKLSKCVCVCVLIYVWMGPKDSTRLGMDL